MSAGLKWGLILILSVIWGSSFILIKYGIAAFTPYQIGSLRCAIAGILLCFWGFPALMIIERSKIKWIALAGAMGNFVPMFLFPIAQQKVSSALAGILDSLVPLFILLFGSLIFKIRYTKSQISGVVIGFIGASCLFYQPSETDGESSHFWYAMIIVIATAMYGINALLLSTKLKTVPPLQLSSALFTIWLLPSLIIFLFSGFFQDFEGTEVQWRGLAAVITLGVVGTTIALMLYYALIQSTGAVFASITTYFMPVIAVIWGVFDGEKIGIPQILGFVLILSGVYLINQTNKSKDAESTD